jgi:hypothetical protein
MFARFAPRGVCAGALSVVTIALASSAFAATDTLTSGNSSLVYNLNSQTGNNSWVVDSVDQFGGSPAGEQWFWVSLNGAAPTSLDNWNLISNITPTANTMTAVYASPVAAAVENSINPDVLVEPETITITTVLSGGSTGSGASAINTTVTFQNNTDSTVNASVYDYVDANINATPANDTLTLGGSMNEANQSDPAGEDFDFSSTGANHTQVATDGSILTELNGGSPFTLSDNYTSPITGNTSFAFEYDGSFTAGDSGQLSINETLNKTGGSMVPMPSAAASALSVLAGLGMIGIFRRARQAIAVR